MAANFKINVILRSGKSALFEGILPGKPFSAEKDRIRLKVGAKHPAPVTVTPPSGELVKSVEYSLYSDMRNYHKVIIPESGRWYINMFQMVSFWRFAKESSIDDAKMPLYIFTGQDLNMSMAFGVIGANYETSFKTLEPKVNRALIAFMRRLSMQIKRGTELYPIPDTIAKKNADGSITEHLYFRASKDAPNQPWLLTLRDFAAQQKRLFKIPDVTAEGALALEFKRSSALAPLWCSWTDWFSDDVTDKVMMRSVEEGLKLGIKNYIIDDGWFGPGLDNDFNVQLNIGDWRPDPKKVPDMDKLVKDMKAAGAVPMIWCAPHAVAPGANCFSERKKYLIVTDKGELLMTSNKFHSLCFMCPEARQIMADLCASLIREWDFEGAKYDLFNCVPNMRCWSKEHTHDVTSMMEGLELTLKQIDEASRALKPNYIVELKQNYGTPFLSRYGSMTRAGDTPYNTEGNFLRTLYVQGYTPYSINDYQTITNEDTPEAAACVVIKMMAVGIPTYSIDFDRLCQANKDVIARYNNWYNENLDRFHEFRVPLDGECNVFKLPGKKDDVYFLVNDAGNFTIRKSSTILNATFKNDLFIRCARKKTATITLFNCFGKQVKKSKVKLGGPPHGPPRRVKGRASWTHIDALPGGMIRIEV